MFFIFSKMLGFFTEPTNAIAVICVIGIALVFLQRQRVGTLLVTFGILSLLVFGYSPVGNVLLLSLTERFPKWQDDGRAPDGIIVLGGAIDADSTAARGSLEVNSAGERVTATLDLARRYPQARIVFTGGSGSLIGKSLSEAPVASEWLQRLDVARERITLEIDSRTTDENAAFTARLVTPKSGERWLLMTSAWHMPRAVGAFRRAGFDVEAYPVDWRTRGWIDATETFDSASAGLGRSDIAVHEWVGLITYWLAGRSNELLPGPKTR